MNLAGRNIIVLDLETQRSSHDCRICLAEEAAHTNGLCPPDVRRSDWPCYSPISWQGHAALGLSIGCTFAYQDMRYHFFDATTLPRTMRQLLADQPLLVSFNGRGFDGPLMAAAARGQCGEASVDAMAWVALWSRSYDVLASIWTTDPDRKYERGLNSLGAVAEANGFGTKALDGALAPRLWAQGHYAEVIEYCMGDVEKTRKLFELICTNGTILRGDGSAITLPMPLIE